MRYKLCVYKIGEKDTDVEILFSHTISKEMSLELQKKQENDEINKNDIIIYVVKSTQRLIEILK